MTLPVSVEVAKAMLQQDRLTKLAAIAELTEQVRNINAQLGGIELALQIQARAAEAQAVASAQTAPEPAPAPAPAPAQVPSDQ